MSRLYINAELRRLVADRAEHICEYCLVSEVDRSSGCQVDHIISVKHGGATTADNLYYACIFCNLQKGTDLGSINWQTGEIVLFFHPRRDFWGEHFQLDEAVIQYQTEIGEVTARILDFNGNERLVERQALIASGQYPSASALKQINK